MSYFAASHNRYEIMIQKYADLPNGDCAGAHQVTIVEGPWK